jgi:hypothetical protein
MREFLDLGVNVEIAMLIAAGIDRQSQDRSDEKTLRSPNLTAPFTVFLQLEECLLDQVFGVFARPSPANQNSLQLAEVLGESAHHNKMTYRLLQSTRRCSASVLEAVARTICLAGVARKVNPHHTVEAPSVN